MPKLFVIALSAAAFAGPAVAQTSPTPAIPVRQLGAITASSTDTLGVPVIVRALSDGSVLVNDVTRRRVLRMDAQLSHMTVVMDSVTSSATGSIPVSVPSSALISYPGDSTLYVDIASQSLLVLAPDGKVAHVMSLPKPLDAFQIATYAFGQPGVDPKGRLVYRGVIRIPPKPPEPGQRIAFQLPAQPDSGPIVRADFDTRAVDTITTLKIFQPGAMTAVPDAQGNISLKMTINPMDVGDEWAMLPDGAIAIVRAHDYHIDWVEMDGTKRSTPKMPFDWKRLTDEQKQFKLDSVRPEIEKAIAAQPVQTIPTADGPRKLQIQVDFVPLNKWPDYEPCISPGSVKADLDGNLWIVPRTSLGGAPGGGLLYDVISKEGQITMRVQFPKDLALAGFGPHGVVYVTHTVGKASFLERTTVR